MKSILIARDRQKEQLRNCLNSNRSEFVIVCGRRRVGKTYLVDTFFNNKFHFKFVGGHNQSTKIQLRNFNKALKQFSNKKIDAFQNWFDAFDALENYLEEIVETDTKKVIFIDEMPWIDTQRSSFVGALENFWNSYANSKRNILLIASGNATSWMSDNLIENQGGLHNRITQRILLRPFNLCETEEYLKANNINWDRYQILQAYMLTGGVPFYLSLFDRKLSIVQNIDNLCFNELGGLRNEFDELYNALFKNADNYIEIVKLLYNNKQGLTRKEIGDKLKFNGSRLNKILKNLKLCSFINEYQLFGRQNVEVYKLIDFYTIFYYKFIENHKNFDDNWWMHNINDQSILSWQGLSFELICLTHHKQIKQALGISGISTSVYTWRQAQSLGKTGAQVDLVIERIDRMIHLCELKFTKDKYSMTQNYADKLSNRELIFKDSTKTKFTVIHTMITTYGIANCQNYSIINSSLTMDDLFRKI